MRPGAMESDKTNAIIGGLIVATLVTLTVLPASFSLLLERGGYREKRPAA